MLSSRSLLDEVGVLPVRKVPGFRFFGCFSLASPSKDFSEKQAPAA